MKSFVNNIEHTFFNFLVSVGFLKKDKNIVFKQTNIDAEIVFSFGCFYVSKANVYNTSCNFNISFTSINTFFVDCFEKDVFLFYDSDDKKVNVISGFGLFYVQNLYGENSYPDGIYSIFTRQQVEETPDLVSAYLQREYYEKCLLDIEEKYGTIEKADKTINDEILSNGFVKKHNINWADFDNQCIRSLLFGYFNNNPRIAELVEICNRTMMEEKLKNPKNSRIPLYNFILNKMGFQAI
ncbi:hypothetical protein [Flavobacterium sp.]|uniref:hypothetical protein n=1 Tax=Flavobacterium sp. TaxID=239 RepID=UPI00262A135A|nr:hypothetical protein [Flavobacterium sp.]